MILVAVSSPTAPPGTTNQWSFFSLSCMCTSTLPERIRCRAFSVVNVCEPGRLRISVLSFHLQSLFTSCRRLPLCESNHARTNPCENFIGWIDCYRRTAPGREPSEFLFVLVSDPARLVAARMRDGGEHSMPSLPRRQIIDDGVGPARCD